MTIRSASAALSALVAMSFAFAAEDDVATSRASQLEDLAVVRDQYLPKEMAYVPATRALAKLQLDKLEHDAGSLSATQFAVELAKLGALTDNAHSGLRLFDPRVQPKARLPLHLLWLSDGLIVARATGEASDLAGARVLAIEGLSPQSLYEGSKVLLGGDEAARKHWLNNWIEAAGVLHALGLAKSPDKLAFKLRLADGREVERTVDMVPAKDLAPTAEIARLWSPEPVKDERDWKAALDTGGLPLYLRDANRPFRAIALEKLDALYVQFRSNEDEDGVSIKAFVEEVRATIARAHPKNLIVDLRFDVGGNLLTTLDFMRQAASLVERRTYVLVGPLTFSAGIISAAAIKKHGAEKVTFVGEPVGDRVHFWSEGALIELPNSHLSFRYADGQFNLQDGCTGEPGCMDDRYHIDVNGVSLDPDMPARLDAAAYFAKRDPAMDAVEKAIAAGSRKTHRR